MGYNSTRYIHALYQVMNLAFADRDFYYGDPYFAARRTASKACSPKNTPRRAYAEIDWDEEQPPCQAPGDPYPFQGGENPYLHHCSRTWRNVPPEADAEGVSDWKQSRLMSDDEAFVRRDDLHPGCRRRRVGRVRYAERAAGSRRTIAGRNRHRSCRQRMQSFVLDERR